MVFQDLFGVALLICFCPILERPASISTCAVLLSEYVLPEHHQIVLHSNCQHVSTLSARHIFATFLRATGVDADDSLNRPYVPLPFPVLGATAG